ncbi:MAG: coenzyme F420-0:L-glutamate ligase [Rhodocyclaceae bacterium]|jgi:coenzyme F420-0:L-glutamate ligase/coenzyme F420-1:gamma-L-glutamate ligase|nr:coenzyme F420-0:L-glutamate ligase [Rhodocyclaceae bacterium]
MQLIALPGLPRVQPGDDLAALIRAALQPAGLELADGDVLVVAQKIVSKAENRYVELNDVTVGEQAQTLAAETGKEPRLVQLILDQSVAVVRHRPGVLIVEHRNGYVHANAGVDQSNIEQPPGQPRALLLPKDPDASAARLRAALEETGKHLNVIINDTAGRAWRNGVMGFALGSAGFEPVVDLIGTRDLFGNTLQVTQVAVADELAAAASFVMGQTAEATPVVLIRGARLLPSESTSKNLIRAREHDLFR